MATIAIVIVILNLHFCFGVFFGQEDDVTFSYNITNISVCRTDEDSFRIKPGLKISDCVKECGLRQHCAALSYGRPLNICNLFMTKNGTHFVDGDCVYITDEDIKIEKSPCNVCPNGQVCDTKSGECKVKECISSTLENGKILGNVHDIGSKVRYVCNRDYWTEVKHAECQNDGTYSAIPICKREIRKCSELKSCNSSYTDGEYWLHVNVFGGRKVKIYCYGMSTATPSEYITIDENNNFGYDAGGYNATDVGTFTKYKKIRIIIETMKIKRNDPTFKEPPTSNLHYASGKSCNCVPGACPPWLGYFQISTVGTGMKFSEKASWTTNGWKPGIANFSRNADSTVISANCGGRCGGCMPNGSLNLLYNEKDVVEDSKATHPFCL